MTFIQSIILGIVEGITEFLPISSTGHLILTGKLLGLPETDFLKSFEIAIQLGAILAVVFLYRRKIFTYSELWKKVAIAFVPTAILGFLMYKILKQFLLSNSSVVLWALFLGGIVLIVFELWKGKSEEKEEAGLEEISSKKAFLIGIAQSVAIVPGVSRSAATILGGMAMGISRKTIVEFSFLLAVPTMLAATTYDLWKSAGSFTLSQFHLLAAGFIVAFFVALLSIKWLLGFVNKHTFISFGVYRIILAIIF